MSQIYKAIFSKYYYGVKTEISREIIPTIVEAARAMRNWIESYKKSAQPEFKPLTDEQKKRQRLRMPINKKLRDVLHDEAQLISWSLALKLLPHKVADKWVELLRYCESGSKERLKELSAIYKKYNTLIDDDWMYYVDADTIGDFVPGLNSEEIIDLVKHWVEGEVKHEFIC